MLAQPDVFYAIAEFPSAAAWERYFVSETNASDETDFP